MEDTPFAPVTSEAPEINLIAVMVPTLLMMLIMFAVVGAIMWWGMFTKAGKTGWHSLIPIYNMVVWMEIIGRPLWWVVMLFIPLINIVFSILACLDTAKSFGKEPAFAIGLWLLSIIFFPILSWGSAQYQGPAAAAQPALA